MNERNDRTWNEETRNQFHPGTILAIIVGQAELSPRGCRELVELTSHFLGYSREYSEAYMDGQKIITGFYTRWLAKMPTLAGPLATLFPELAKYGLQLETRGFLNDCIQDEAVRAALWYEMEVKFGHAMTVFPSITPSAKEPVLPGKKTTNWSAGTFQPGPKTPKYITLPPINTVKTPGNNKF